MSIYLLLLMNERRVKFTLRNSLNQAKQLSGLNSMDGRYLVKYRDIIK